MIPSLILALGLISSVFAADYSETFVGCTSIGTGTSGALLSPQVYSVDECNFACADAGYAYAYFANPAMSYCSCKDVGPESTEINSVASGSTNCGNFQSTVMALQTDYTFTNCYSLPSPSQADLSTPQDSFQACWDACNTYPVAMLSPSGSSYTCSCFISGSDGGGIPDTCGNTNVYFAYSHTAASTPSLVDRRRRRLDRLRRDQMVLERFCPGGFEACNVPGSEDSFECIDVSSELESCGGCLYGTYGNSTASTGVDCSILPGAAFGSSTCASGQCQISACREGFQLVDGRCQ
ncbi:hypothetical protein I302_106479 [Kwoniella bestiolae CBS 10118]|uniref:Protein CPL1-like domain-containing protein n=1 Tax=Kwoniella bestiolae CBS 10118 TaxID=1296100 RepID=A0A1B9G198_9TREE|nr:hypothetical protein I302_06264 [Kwoniella bestiolae CBS 10118]OCF24803.1 hypothetical protein I302_06264 [Kwoniella bestiolae CBS 10118]